MSGHNYIFSKRIARGGMAEIFLGKVVGSDDFQRLVAIKRILPHYAQEEEYIEMFRAEASICKRLQHNNLVQVYDFNRVDESYAIIMEFVDGSDLRSLLAACEKSGVRLTIPMAVYIAVQAARGLHYAHTRIDEISRRPLEIVHRDISPQNLLIGYEGEVKVIDFGIAKFEAKTQETKPGVVKGKYSYMSPEQVTAKNLDARTDVFSLAIVIWEILAMKRLFAGETEVETIKNVQEGVIKKPLQECNQQVDDDLNRILLKALAKDRRRRYQSAAEFERDLVHYLNSRYPEFSASELGNFVSNLFAKKRLDTQKLVRQLLSEPVTQGDHLPEESDEESAAYTAAASNVANATDASLSSRAHASSHSGKIVIGVGKDLSRKERFGSISVSHVSVQPSLSRPAYNSRKGSPGSGHAPTSSRSPRRPSVRSSQKIRHSSFPLVFLGTAVAIALVSLGLVMHRSNKSAIANTMQLNLSTNPSTVRLKVDGKIQKNGRYIKTPARIRLPAGRHTVSVSRQGYQPQRISINGKPGEAYAAGKIKLQRDPSTMVLRLQLSTVPRRAVVVDVDQGWYRGNAPAVLSDLPAGQPHTIEVYPNHPDNKGAFKCEFTPPAYSRAYHLELQISRAGSSRCIAR